MHSSSSFEFFIQPFLIWQRTQQQQHREITLFKTKNPTGLSSSNAILYRKRSSPNITLSSFRTVIVLLIVVLIQLSITANVAATAVVSTRRTHFFQTFVVDNKRIFEDDEISSFQNVMEGFTDDIIIIAKDAKDGKEAKEGEEEGIITTSCTILDQFIMAPDDGQYGLNQIDYVLSWSSTTVDVSNYGKRFEGFIGENYETLARILQRNGISSVSEANRIFLTDDQTIITEEQEPSMSPLPPIIMTTTNIPSFTVSIRSEIRFIQDFNVDNHRIFSEEEIISFETIMAGYRKTNFYNNNNDKVDDDSSFLITASCTILTQNIDANNNNNLKKEEDVLSIAYSMSWTSVYVDVTNYPVGFETFINRNYDTVANQLKNDGGLSGVVKAGFVFKYKEDTIIAPSASPTFSISGWPSYFPTVATLVPSTSYPTANPSTIRPSYFPSSSPSIPSPSAKPSFSPSTSLSATPSFSPSTSLSANPSTKQFKTVVDKEMTTANALFTATTSSSSYYSTRYSVGCIIICILLTTIHFSF